MRIVFSLIFLILGLILILFFGNYKGTTIKYSFVYVLAGFLSILIGFLFIKSANNALFKKKKPKKRQKKASAGTLIKIKVDLNSCKIVDNKYFIEEDIYSSNKISFLNSLYDSSKNIKTTEITHARIIFNYSHNGNNLTFVSPIIEKDKNTLLFLLEKQKYTYIYLDNNNFNNYNFDLDFLD